MEAADEEEQQKGWLQTQQGAVVHPCAVIKPVTALSDTLLSFGRRSLGVQRGWAALSQLVNTACQSQHDGSKLWNALLCWTPSVRNTESDALSSEVIDFKRATKENITSETEILRGLEKQIGHLEFSSAKAT